MTPTADLMRLLDKWREDAETPDLIAWTTRHSLRRCADELQAALTASCDARVGGECENCGGRGFVVGYHDPYNRGDVSSPSDMPCPDCATPAQPKASEPQVSEDVVLWALGTRVPEEVRARYGYPVHYTVSDYMAGDTNENRMMMRTLLESVSRQFPEFATNRPTASEKCIHGCDAMTAFCECRYKASEGVDAVGDEDISEPFPRVHGYDPSGERRTVTVEWRPGEFVGYIRLGDRTKWKEAPPAAYSIDADPAGIRERVASAVLGALMQGAHGTNPPPVGHWLADFWNMARADATHPKASEAQDDRDRLVGSVLDAWEMLPNDVKCEVKQCALGNSLDALLNWMENEQPVPAQVKAPRAVRKTGPGSLKASDAKDAARYRWLRERHWSHSDMCVVVSPREVVRLGAHCPSHDSLDAAIDAAMTATLTAPGADDGHD